MVLEEGLIHSIGVSNYEFCHLEEMPTYSTTVPAVNQVEYHPHFRRLDIKNYCDEHGIFFQVFSRARSFVARRLLQAFSSLARHHPDVIGDPVVNDLSGKYKTSPQVNDVSQCFPHFVIAANPAQLRHYAEDWHRSEVNQSCAYPREHSVSSPVPR